MAGFFRNNTVGLIFLDINAPDLSGTDFARIVQQKYLIIFTIAYSEYAVENYKLNYKNNGCLLVKFIRKCF